MLDLLLDTESVLERKLKTNIATSCDGINLNLWFGVGNGGESRAVLMYCLTQLDYSTKLLSFF